MTVSTPLSGVNQPFKGILLIVVATFLFSSHDALSKYLSGFYPIDAGSILVDGRSVIGLAPRRIARRGIGRTFQTPRMLPALSVLDNALLGAYPAERQSRTRPAR